MGSPYENPVVYYGVGLSSAMILAIVAFVLLEGTIRWIVMGLAVVEAVILPQLLKMSAE